MRVSQRKGSSEIPRRPRRPERLADGCIDCGSTGGELGLDRDGLCAECGYEGAAARIAITSLIDHGVGVSRAAVEAL